MGCGVVNADANSRRRYAIHWVTNQGLTGLVEAAVEVLRKLPNDMQAAAPRSTTSTQRTKTTTAR